MAAKSEQNNIARLSLAKQNLLKQNRLTERRFAFARNICSRSDPFQEQINKTGCCSTKSGKTKE